MDALGWPSAPEQGPLWAQAAFLGCLCPIQQPRHLQCKHSGPHTQWLPPAWSGQPNPSTTPSSPPLSFPLGRGSEGGTGRGTRAQARGGWERWARMNGHANETPLNRARIPQKGGPLQGGPLPPYLLPHLWAEPPATEETSFPGEGSQLPGPPLGLASSFPPSGTQAWEVSLLGAWPSTVGLLSHRTVTACPQPRPVGPARVRAGEGRASSVRAELWGQCSRV